MRYLSTSSGSGWPLVALGAMLWGSDFLLRPALLAHPGFTAVKVVLYEHLALAAIFAPLLLTRRADWLGASRRQWLALVYIAWAGSAVATVLLSIAYELGNPLTATLLQKTQPLFAVALAGIVLREKRRPMFWGMFCLAVAATYLLSFGFMSPLQMAASSRSVGIVCAVGAAALWGSCTVVGRVALAGMAPPLVSGWRFVLALPLLAVLDAPALAASGGQSVGVHWNNSTVLLLAGLVLLPDVLGMVLYYAGLRTTPASLATLAEMAYPITALLLGSVLLHQKLQIGQWIGVAALIVSLQLIQRTHVVDADTNRGDDPGASRQELPVTA